MVVSSDTRQRLLNSARDLIYSRSFSDVGVQAICEHAGVRKGSFYHFFPSKRELTLAVLDEFLLDFEQDLLGQAFASRLPPMDRFERLVDLVYRFQKEITEVTGHLLGCPFGNLAVELSTLDEPIRLRVEKIFLGIQQYFQDALEEAVATGAIQATDPDATAQAMFAYLEGVILMAKTRNDPEVIRKLGPAVVTIRVAVS